MAAATELNMKPGDTSYADVLERVGWGGGVEGAMENPSGDPSTARANTRLREASKVYYKTQGDAIDAVQQALRGSGYDWDASTESWSHIPYETSSGSKLIPIGGNGYLHISMYRMPSGNYELTAHVDRGSRQAGKRNPSGQGTEWARSAGVAARLSGSRRSAEQAWEDYARTIPVTTTVTGTLRRDLREWFYAGWNGLTSPHARYSGGGGNERNPSGRAFMLSYLPAGGGSYRTVPYSTYGEAKRAMSARMGSGTQRMEIRDMQTSPSRLLDKWSLSGSVQSLNSRRGNPSRHRISLRRVGNRIYLEAGEGGYGGSRVAYLQDGQNHITYDPLADTGEAMGLVDYRRVIADLGLTPATIRAREAAGKVGVGWSGPKGPDAVGGEVNPSNPRYPEPHEFTPSAFTRAYMEAALWSSTDDDGEPLDKNYSTADLSDETQAKMYADCEKFQELSGEHSKEAGHDFWLTRNGHGAGFWDGDWPDDKAEKLTKLAKRFGEYDLYVGDYGTLYGTGGRHVNPGSRNPSGKHIGQVYVSHDRLDVEALQEHLEKDHGIPAMVVNREDKRGGKFWILEVPQADMGRAVRARNDWFDEARHGSTMNPRHNPESEAADMYETFHGEPSREILEIEETHHYHENLASLGSAVNMLVKTTHGPVVKITFDGNTHVSSNEAGTQLYMVDGDQSLNLKALGFKGERKGKHGAYTDEKDKMLIGEIQELTYRARKGFDKFKLTDYYHGLGEESGVRPSLVYDLLNKQMEIVGGQYKVLDVGIVN